MTRALTTGIPRFVAEEEKSSALNLHEGVYLALAGP